MTFTIHYLKKQANSIPKRLCTNANRVYFSLKFKLIFVCTWVKQCYLTKGSFCFCYDDDFLTYRLFSKITFLGNRATPLVILNNTGRCFFCSIKQY